MRVSGIILSRLNSMRLPRKALLEVCGKPILWHLIERVKRSKSLTSITLAIPHADEELLAIANKCGIGCFRYAFSENDVIGRMYQCAESVKADIIVRLNGDNVLVEPAEIDRAVNFYLEKPRIFVSNMHEHIYSAIIDPEHSVIDNGYPDGIGCEVFSMSTLTWMHEYIKKPNLREHPHMYFHENQLVDNPRCPQEFARPDLKLDVNTEDDYKFVKDIYDNLYQKNNNFHITDVITYLDAKK